MGYFTLFVAIAYFIIVVFIFNRQQNKFSYLYGIYILILLGFVYNCPDYGNYKNFYYTVENISYYNLLSDPGYSYINLFCTKLGLSYTEFRFLSSTIFFFILLFVIYKLTNNTVFVLGLYIIYPLDMDICQVRNFMAYIIFLLGVYIASKYYKQRYLILTLFLFIAILFHKAFALYFPFIILEFIRKYSIGQHISQLLFLIGILMPIYEKSIIDNTFILSLFLIENDAYSNFQVYSDAGVQNGYWLTYLKLILMLFFSKYVYKKLQKNMKITDIKLKFSEYVYHMFRYMIMLSPMIGISATMFRYPRNFLVPLYIICGIYLDNLKDKRERIRSIIIFIFIVFIITVIESYGASDTIDLILTNNYLFNLIE